jgi:replicative DNA helicase
MSKKELNAKTISRYSHIQTSKLKLLGNGKALTTRDILSGRIGGVALGEATDEQGKIYLDALAATRKIAGYTRIFIGENDVDVDKVREVVDVHIRATKRKPFVILDYLQILQPSEDAHTTDKRLLTDYDVTRLKVLSRDFRIPVLVISAFNRTNYLEPVSFGSFRESSGIEYSSDILLAMQYHGMDYQKHWFTSQTGKKRKVFESTTDHNTRVRELLSKMDEDGANGLPLPIELKILKNRNGSKGSLYYDFLPAYNYYAEGTTRAYIMPAEYYGDDEDDASATPGSSVVSSGNGVTIGNKVK